MGAAWAMGGAMSDRDEGSAAVAVGDARTSGTDASAEATPDRPSDRLGRRRPLRRSEVRSLIGLVVVGAVLRIVWVVVASVDPPVHFMQSGDQYSYWYYANEIADGRGYVSYITGEATAYYPIGYPAILAGLFWLADLVPFVDLDPMLVAGLFHAAIGTATIALTFVVGRRLAGPVAGLVAAGILALFPNMIFQVASLQLETTFVFFTMAALAIIVDHDWSTGPPSRNRLLAFGAVLAVSMLVRPFSAPMLLGLLIALLVAGVGWRKALAALAVPVIVLVVVFAPWTIRNAVRLDAFVPSSTNMGDTLCIDRNLDATGGFRWGSHDGCVDPTLPEAERNTGNTRKAIRFVVDHPDREALQIARRARLMFAEDHDGLFATETLGGGQVVSDGTRDVLETVADGYFTAVGIAALIGLPLLVRRAPRSERWLVVVPMAALLVIPLLLWGTPRFHVPLVPFMAVSAAALVTLALRARRGDEPHEQPATEPEKPAGLDPEAPAPAGATPAPPSGHH